MHSLSGASLLIFCNKSHSYYFRYENYLLGTSQIRSVNERHFFRWLLFSETSFSGDSYLVIVDVTFVYLETDLQILII